MADESGAPAVPAEDLRVELERLRLLHSISQEFNSSLDFDELLPKVFDSVLTAVGAAGGSLWIAEGDVLRCKLALGAASQKLIGTTMPIGTGFVGDVARKQRTTIVRDAMLDARFQQRVDRSSTLITTTLMATPMLTKGITVGAIQVVNKVRGDGIFDDRDREILEGLAASAAVALRNAQLHAAEKRARDLAVLLEISREITSTLDLDHVLQSVVNLASRALTFDQGAVGLLEKHQSEIPRELAEILANQTTGALRNAQLYNQVPLVDALGALAAKKRALMQLPRRRRQIYAGAVVAAVAGFTLIRWPLRVDGANPTFRASAYVEARTLVPGIVERVLVHEGTEVGRGAPILQLRDAELRAEREAAAAEAAAAERSAAVAASRGNPAEERLQRTRAQAFRREVALLDDQVGATTVRAPVSGMVLTPRPEQRLGGRLQGGELAVTLRRTDTLELS